MPVLMSCHSETLGIHAYLLALNNNNSLYLEALDKNVVMVSTSTLLATLSTLHTINYYWRYIELYEQITIYKELFKKQQHWKML